MALKPRDGKLVSTPDFNFFGSTSGLVHHYECFLCSRGTEGWTGFNSVAEAVKSDYRPCKVCNPVDADGDDA